MTKKFDSITQETIKILIDLFYSKVRKDSDLKLIFEEVIGVDDDVWYSHLQHMYNFWSSVMISADAYHGNPMKKHNDLPTFDLSLFDRWLELFEEAAKEIHTDIIVAQYKDKSQRIAESLKLGIRYKKESNCLM